MMKKLTKAALLAAATAFMLAACSHSSGGGSGEEENPPNTPEVPEENSGRTTGSWIFASQADTIDWVAKFKTNTITNENDGTCSLDKSGDITIESVALSTSSDGLTLTILAEKPWTGATNPNYSLQDPASGLRIKNPALKIADVKGTVKVTIEWACIKGKAASDRKLQLLKDGGTVVKEAGNDDTSNATTNTAMTPFEATVACGEGTNLYIGATNNVFITSVKVEEADSTEVKVTNIAISADSEKKVTVNKTLQLTATVAPEEATSKSVKWESSDDTIATVSASGLVTGVAAGEVTITATATDGSGVKDAIKLTVVADSETPPEGNPPSSNPDPDDQEEEETPVIGEKLSVDFTTFEAAVVCEAASTTPVRLGDTDFFAVSGTDGKVIELKKQNNAMALNFGGAGAVDKNAVFFYAKKGSATVTVKYYQGSADRYVKVLNEDMDTTEATDDEKTTTDKAVKTRVIAITIDEDSTPVYIGSANNGIYVASIDVVYN